MKNKIAIKLVVFGIIFILCGGTLIIYSNWKKQPSDNKPQEEKELILEFKKRQAFSILVLETDKHIENYSYIKGKDFSLSPNYDSEASLLLDNDIPTIKKILSDYTTLKEVVDITLPRIGLINENNFNSYWKDTLDELIIDDDVYDYCLNVLCQKIDMDLILDKVEERINAKLDDDIRLIAKYAYEERFRVFKQIIVGDI